MSVSCPPSIRHCSSTICSNRRIKHTEVSGAGVVSFKDLQDKDPFGWYANARSQGSVIWDESFGTWLATDYQSEREINRLENRSFLQKNVEPGSEYDKVSGGRIRHVDKLGGTQHTKLHAWLMSAFRAVKASAIQGASFEMWSGRCSAGFTRRRASTWASCSTRFRPM